MQITGDREIAVDQDQDQIYMNQVQSKPAAIFIHSILNHLQRLCLFSLQKHLFDMFRRIRNEYRYGSIEMQACVPLSLHETKYETWQ